jgi:GntR family transcriptional regulator, transcriptional repressor for pyruvate dehydrogenase complex
MTARGNPRSTDGDAPPRPRSRISDVVHERLRADILAGRCAPGDALPSERDLSDSLGVNRHAVREALKRLEQAGLVHIAQGGATRALDWRRHGGLDLLLDLVFSGDDPFDPEVMRAILELRATIGADAARLCARRATARIRRAVAAVAEEVAAARDLDRRVEAHERLWALVVDGSGNVAYRLAFNTLLVGLGRIPGAAAAILPAATLTADVHALGAAIEGGDGEAAARAAWRMLDPPERGGWRRLLPRVAGGRRREPPPATRQS